MSSIDPDTGEVVALFHPRRHRWADHFRIVDGRIEPRTPTGRVTERLLQMNHPNRILERKQLIQAGLLLPPTE